MNLIALIYIGLVEGLIAVLGVGEAIFGWPRNWLKKLRNWRL